MSLGITLILIRGIGLLEEEDGDWTYRRHFKAATAIVWELLVAPELKEGWMDGINSVTADNQIGRVGNGSTYAILTGKARIAEAQQGGEAELFTNTRARRVRVLVSISG